MKQTNLRYSLERWMWSGAVRRLEDGATSGSISGDSGTRITLSARAKLLLASSHNTGRGWGETNGAPERHTALAICSPVLRGSGVAVAARVTRDRSPPQYPTTKPYVVLQQTHIYRNAVAVITRTLRAHTHNERNHLGLSSSPAT